MVQSASGARSPADVLRCWFIIVAFGALLLPVFGPVLDHHFAERQPDHTHVYLGGAVPDHVHPYERHDHSHHHHGHSHGYPEINGDIVYLTSSEGIGRGLTAVMPALGRDYPAFPGPYEGLLKLGAPREGPAPAGALVQPPKKPPRA